MASQGLKEAQIVEARVADLRENPENPRTITTPRLDALARSLAADPEMLDARPIVALPDGTVIAGNKRLRAARMLGWETIKTFYIDLDPQRARLWLLRDNNPYGDWDEEPLAVILDELAAAEVDLDLTGFDAADLDRLIGELQAPDTERDDGAQLALLETTLGPPRHEVEPGERWRLSDRHTLIVAGVYDGHAAWGPLLPEHDLFLPYPTPMIPLTDRAETLRLLLVQPNLYLAGYLLDRYEEGRGAEELEQFKNQS